MKNDTISSAVSVHCAYSNGNLTDPKQDLERVYFSSYVLLECVLTI